MALAYSFHRRGRDCHCTAAVMISAAVAQTCQTCHTFRYCFAARKKLAGTRLKEEGKRGPTRNEHDSIVVKEFIP